MGAGRLRCGRSRDRRTTGPRGTGAKCGALPLVLMVEPGLTVAFEAMSDILLVRSLLASALVPDTSRRVWSPARVSGWPPAPTQVGHRPPWTWQSAVAGLPAEERVVGAVDVRTVVLVVHVAGGAVALLCAAVVMAAGSRQDWSTGWGTGYVGCVAVTAVSAVALTGPGATLPAAVRVVLLAVAVVTAAAAARGLQLARRPPAGRGSARPVQLRLLWGSVTSLVSAIAVVSLPVVVWVPVIIAGTLLTERGYRRARLDPAWA